MQEVIFVETNLRESFYDITSQVQEVMERSRVEKGIVNIYVDGEAAAVMIQESDDYDKTDMVSFLRKLVPFGVWEHDKEEENSDAHLKSSLIGPGENIPIVGAKLKLSKRQNIYLCEFDGPRSQREIIVTVLGA